MTLMTRFRIAVLAAAVLGATPLAPALGQENCLSDADIQTAVAAGQILPLARVLEREGVPPSTQVLSVRVCEAEGGLSYILAVLGAAGEARNLTLRAQ